ncbi:ATP-binding cassette domain-containing protein [Streptomyces sp. NBC_01340]|uniref:ATP-binding cassette domain-containing protein n=1 Tax=Streptomyces TaxID=1883 RepID=UPI002250A4DC|nr:MULTISPECIES: ATP-binding cassette domain-containing protein [unclassified Streptomyces]MCX4457471.1 ATP-binding cassette domain-containing protein [Streptomyces sp. NBC_01719]MCX4496828.1 ATP-binding cassette domain-containing protein [Streptomyces sp. NBC_01728]WSI41708.1 ATP-binding cassette domain-containing protein [Streptomyces sp. NBC_01340]
MIQAKGLAKTFHTKQGSVQAVAGVDFTVNAGEIVGFLGPNGAGKTTTMRMLTTLLPPSSGTAVIAGCDLLHEPAKVRTHIGYVSQAGGAKPSSPVRRDLVLQGRLYGMSRPEAEARADEVIAQLGLGDLASRVIRTLSGGQRRRVDMALGLVHEPKLLFLDEPTANLDPESRNGVWDHIRRLRDEQGTTVFLTTHYLDEADNLCDRVLIIDKGRIIAEDSPRSLKAAISHDTIEIEVDGDAARATDLLAAHSDVHDVSVDGVVLSVSCRDAERLLADLLRVLESARIRVESLRVVKPTLDDVFMTMTDRRPQRDADAVHA